MVVNLEFWASLFRLSQITEILCKAIKLVESDSSSIADSFYYLFEIYVSIRNKLLTSDDDDMQSVLSITLNRIREIDLDLHSPRRDKPWIKFLQMTELWGVGETMPLIEKMIF